MVRGVVLGALAATGAIALVVGPLSLAAGASTQLPVATAETNPPPPDPTVEVGQGADELTTCPPHLDCEPVDTTPEPVVPTGGDDLTTCPQPTHGSVGCDSVDPAVPGELTSNPPDDPDCVDHAQEICDGGEPGEGGQPGGGQPGGDGDGGGDGGGGGEPDDESRQGSLARTGMGVAVLALAATGLVATGTALRAASGRRR